MLRNICNYLVFLPGWFVCMYYHNLPASLLGLALFAVNIAMTGKFKKYLLLTVIIAIFGYLSDVLILLGNVYRMTGSPANNLWIISVWLLFASTFSFSLKFFTKINIILQFLIAGAIGNVTYFFALRCGSIELTIPEYKALVVFFFNFGLLAPMLFRANNILSVLIEADDEPNNLENNNEHAHSSSPGGLA